jgi:hypothetical protein
MSNSQIQVATKNSQEKLMIISDLNHLEVVEGTGVIGGGGFYIDNFKKEIVNINELVKINKDLVVKVDIEGNYADAESDAQAFGKNTDAQTISAIVVEEGKYSVSTSLAKGGAVK